MAENVGGVYYDIEVRTQSLLDGEKQVKKASTGIENSLNSAGKAVERFGVRLSDADIQMGRFIGASGRVHEATGKFVTGMLASGKSVNEFSESVRQAVTKTDTLAPKMNKTAQDVNTALGSFGRTAGQAGMQISQFVGQLQGGVNPMVAIAQQGADLGFVMGVPLLGAVVSIAAALGGMLIPSLFSSDDAAEALKKTMESLKQTAVTTDNGITVLSDRLVKLAEISERAALAEATAGMLKAEKAAKGAAEQISELFDAGRFQFAVDVLTSGVSAISGVPMEVVGITRNIGEALGKTGEEAKNVGYQVVKLYGQIQKAPTAENFNKLQDYIAGIAQESKSADPKVYELISSMSEFFQTGRDAAETANFLSNAIKNFGEVSKTSSAVTSDAFVSLKNQLAIATQQMNGGEDAAKRLALAFTLGLTNAEQIPPEILKTFNELLKVEKQIEANKKAEQDAEAATKKAQADKKSELEKAATAWDNLSESITKQTATAQGAEAANDYAIEQIKLAGQAAGKTAEEINKMVAAQNALFAAQQQQKAMEADDTEAKQRAERIAALEQEIYLAGIKNKLGNEEYERRAAIAALGSGATDPEVARIDALVTKMQTLRQEAALLGPTLQSSFDQTTLSGLDQFSQGMADILISGASASEVFSNLARTIATQLLTAIIRYYVGQAAASMLGIAQTTAAGVAQGAALTAAYTPAAIAANIASFGGAATAAAATAPVAASATIAAVATGSMAGGLLNGGPTIPGMIHPITEDGNPEILMQGGKQYLLPGSRGGRVISNKDMQEVGGGANVTVNVVNNASNTTVSETRSTAPDGRQTVEIIVADIESRGKIHRAITNTTTAGNRI